MVVVQTIPEGRLAEATKPGSGYKYSERSNKLMSVENYRMNSVQKEFPTFGYDPARAMGVTWTPFMSSMPLMSCIGEVSQSPSPPSMPRDLEVSEMNVAPPSNGYEYEAMDSYSRSQYEGDTQYMSIPSYPTPPDSLSRESTPPLHIHPGPSGQNVRYLYSGTSDSANFPNLKNSVPALTCPPTAATASHLMSERTSSAPAFENALPPICAPAFPVYVGPPHQNGFHGYTPTPVPFPEYGMFNLYPNDPYSNCYAPNSGPIYFNQHNQPGYQYVTCRSTPPPNQLSCYPFTSDFSIPPPGYGPVHDQSYTAEPDPLVQKHVLNPLADEFVPKQGLTSEDVNYLHPVKNLATEVNSVQPEAVGESESFEQGIRIDDSPKFDTTRNYQSEVKSKRSYEYYSRLGASVLSYNSYENSSASTIQVQTRKKKREIICRFCFKKRGTGDYNHPLKDSFGNVLCPVLQKVVCPKCGATGAKAHTYGYCHITEDNTRSSEAKGST
ncbi:hypothetical protein SK128_008501 [Halocaridina rubra]|uniref:Nanos-type domain-containing protein n=1 Tax=Halocaridina rubra TaxID=373956 RepID=A0AAN8XKU8_HALRR